MDAGNLQHIGERLRGERARLGLSQVVFSDACGVNRSTLATWEKGEQSPTAAVLSLMAGDAVTNIETYVAAHPSRCVLAVAFFSA